MCSAMLVVHIHMLQAAAKHNACTYMHTSNNNIKLAQNNSKYTWYTIVMHGAVDHDQ